MGTWGYLAIAVGAGIVSYQLTAHAGLKSTTVVKIVNNGSTASVTGSLGSARNSSDGVQWIFCRVTASSTDPSIAFCGAKDASGKTRSCLSSDADVIAAISGANGDSLISWDQPTTAPFDCTTLVVENGSDSAPK